MPDITIPKLNTVDTAYLLVEWLYAEGAEVPAGASVAVVETSKTAEELVCEEGGVLHRLAEPPAECGLGEVIGRLFADEDERLRSLDRPAAAAGPSDRAAPSGEFIVTKSARELIERNGIGDDALRGLGRKVVRSRDVEELLRHADTAEPAPRDGAVYRPTRIQRAVAEAVSLSHRTIPAAYCVAKIDVDAALALLDRVSAGGQRIGLPELLVKCVALLHADFPLFFGTVRDDGTVALPAAARIGVTVDVGTGLSVPVIAAADRAPLALVARQLTDLRVKALRGRLTQADLAGGNIALALNDDDGIVAAQPLILPPQVCMLNLCSVQRELRLDGSGGLVARRYVHLGLAYDHRLINGREAALFLRALKAALEDPGSVDEPAHDRTGVDAAEAGVPDER